MVQIIKQSKKPIIGFAVDYFKGLAPSIIIDTMKFIGIEFVEINASIFNDIEKSIKSLTNIKTAFHLPYNSDAQLDLDNMNTRILIEKILANKKQLNIQHVVCHPPEAAKTFAEFESASITLFQNLTKLGLPVYFENVMSISPENFDKFTNSAKQAMGKQFAGQCWDASHYLVAGYDPIKRYKLHAENIGSIHLSDCLPDTDSHLPFFNKGSLPIQDIIKMLKNEKYSGPITLEIIPNSRSDIKLYISSYIMLLKKLHYSKYLSTKVRLFFLKPFINQIITKEPSDIKFLKTDIT